MSVMPLAEEDQREAGRHVAADHDLGRDRTGLRLELGLDDEPAGVVDAEVATEPVDEEQDVQHHGDGEHRQAVDGLADGGRGCPGRRQCCISEQRK